MALSIPSIFDSLSSGLRKTAIYLSIWLPIYLSISLAYAHTIYMLSYGYALLYPVPFSLFAPTHNFHTSQRLGCNRVRLAPWQLGSYVRLCLIG